MDHTATAAKKSMWFRHVGKVVTLAASSGAALVSIFTALYSYGIIGHSESHQSIGNLGAAWVGLRPAIDTAYAIDDTVHYAATVTDNNGSVLVGARPTWTTGDSSVATVLADGSVIAQGPGRTIVSVVVGKLVTHSTIIVRQRVTSVEVGRASGDSVIVLPEGAELQLKARAVDARGHPINGLEASWHIDDNAVAVLDSTGLLTGRNAGKTLLTAKVEGVSARTAVSVVTPAAAISLVAGSSQRALAGKALAQSIVVRATNRKGGPAAAKRVTFRVVDGQGSVDPATIVTDADGRARANWTLGADPGRQTLFASVENVDSALAIEAEADPVAENTRVLSLADHLSGRAGDTVGDSVAVRVTDSTGRVLPDVPVRWVALDGTVVGASPRTDSLGIARATWTLARKTGEQRVRAQVGSGSGLGIAPLTIVATALAGPPANIAVSAGDNQRAPAGTELPKAVMVKVVDENGSPVVGATVALAASGGTIADSLVTTDSAGCATARWTMGRSAGDYSLAVHVDGVKKLLKLVAHATPAPAANLAFDDAPGEARSRDSSKRKRLLALVTDVYGNPVPDARVYFSVKSGTVTPARAVSDAKGHAVVTWKLGSKPGEQTLTGMVKGTDVVGEYVTQVGGRETLAKTVSLKSTDR